MIDIYWAFTGIQVFEHLQVTTSMAMYCFTDFDTKKRWTRSTTRPFQRLISYELRKESRFPLAVRRSWTPDGIVTVFFLLGNPLRRLLRRLPHPLTHYSPNPKDPTGLSYPPWRSCPSSTPHWPPPSPLALSGLSNASTPEYAHPTDTSAPSQHPVPLLAALLVSQLLSQLAKLLQKPLPRYHVLFRCSHFIPHVRRRALTYSPQSVSRKGRPDAPPQFAIFTPPDLSGTVSKKKASRYTQDPALPTAEQQQRLPAEETCCGTSYSSTREPTA